MPSSTIKYNIHSLKDAEAVLKNREQKKIGNNTWLIREHETSIVVRFHATIIARFKPRYASYYSGGWHTYTTCDRINQLLPEPWSVYQRKYEWFVWNPRAVVTLPWQDGIMFFTN